MTRLLKVLVKPGRRKNHLQEQTDGSYLAEITARADNGKANAALLALMSEQLRIPLHTIEIKSGSTSKIKWIRIASNE